jgi:hypothetical protein
MTTPTLTVPFRPRAFDKVWAFVLLFAGLDLAGLGGWTLLHPPVFTLSCDRAAGTCTQVSPGLMGGGSPSVFGLDGVHGSRVVELEHHATSWTVTTARGERSLGNRTTDAERVDAYRRLAADFQAFLDDPARPTFSASYAGIGGPPGWLFGVLGLALAVAGLWWIHGWSAELLFDRAAGTLTIRQRPTLLLGPAERQVPLAEVAGVDARRGGVIVGGGTVHTATVVIRGTVEPVLFKRRLVLDRSSRDSIAAHVEAMRAFLGPAADG